MPLNDPTARRQVHHRTIDLQTFAREDGLFDVEAHLLDRKPFAFRRLSRPTPIPPGEALHDLRIRMTIDQDLVVQDIQAASVTTPWALCRNAESTLSVLLGERIARGWSSKVKERLRGAAGCTHLMEMLIPMATVALQGIRGLQPEHVLAVDSDGVPRKIDSCYAYSREREVVQQLWPLHYRPPVKN